MRGNSGPRSRGPGPLLTLLLLAGGVSGAFLLLCRTGTVDPDLLLRRQPEETAVSAPAVLLQEQEAEEDQETAGEKTPVYRLLSLEELPQAKTLAQGYDGVMLPMKAADGNLAYVSALTLAMDAGTSFGDPDRNRALQALNETPGLYTVAQLSCLRDAALARARPDLTLKRISGSPWRDEGGIPWLDPAQEEVAAYLAGICRELAALGFDEIRLTDWTYPTQGDWGTPADKTAQEEALCQRLREAALPH